MDTYVTYAHLEWLNKAQHFERKLSAGVEKLLQAEETTESQSDTETTNIAALLNNLLENQRYRLLAGLFYLSLLHSLCEAIFRHTLRLSSELKRGMPKQSSRGTHSSSDESAEKAKWDMKLHVDWSSGFVSLKPMIYLPILWLNRTWNYWKE